jgi:hypothetical protein
MNEQQQKFLELAEKKEFLARQLKQTLKDLAEIMRAMPLGEMFQDPKEGIVYQIIVPDGKFVEYQSIDYIRTCKEGERNGSMSMKAAQEAGFDLKEEEKK